MLRQHEQLFSEALETVLPYKATLHEQGAKPQFLKPPPVPFAIRDCVGRELDSLEQQGTLKKESNSDWVASIVAVPKKDGKVRICGDYKVTINQLSVMEQYPLPNVDDMFATLVKGKIFSKLNLSQAYLNYN